MMVQGFMRRRAARSQRTLSEYVCVKLNDTNDILSARAAAPPARLQFEPFSLVIENA